MTDEELIEQLRSEPTWGGLVALTKQAADRIEALTAKVKLMDDLDAINGEKIEALEAKLAKAVEALEALIHLAHDCEKKLTEDLHHMDFCGESEPLTKARATLAGIKGESHE